MNQNCPNSTRYAIIVFATFVLFALMLLAAILAPGTISLAVGLPALVGLLRVALSGLRDGPG
jgi:hypothetical protein